ncbi:MAG: glycosyltransferase family 4 protein, partial [Phycisphaerales bacterium]|nr:glycosyltransferase family 4 protein [Phycisphaerales bacterium]
DRISDALVLVLDEGSTLVQLERSGALARHRDLWRAMAERHGRLILVSHDRGEEAETAAELARSLDAECVCDDLGTFAHEHQDRAASAVVELLKGCETAVVQAVGLMAAPTALAVSSALQHAGTKAALLAEGADLWSRQSICEFGPTSRAALEAAYREQLACTAAHVVLAGCGPVADDLVWRFNLPAERVRVVPMPVLPDMRCVPAEKREKDLILAFGPVTKRSRLNLAVEAVAQLRKTDCPTARLRVLLDGPESDALRAQAEELEVPLELVPHPTAEEANEALEHCTLMVYTATSETNPPAVFEALAVGTPLVLAVDPLCAMSIVHGVSGLRMPPEAEALARGIGGLLMDAPWRDALGNAGRERAFRDHSCEAVAEAMATAQEAALEIAGRQNLPIDPGLILASGGLSDLGPQEAAAAWSRAIAEHLAHVGDDRAAHLAAIAEAIGALPDAQPQTSAAQLLLDLDEPILRVTSSVGPVCCRITSVVTITGTN